MTHLKKFGLKNFRVFKDLAEFEFAPITIFTGTNSSGKSSVIKALLLLQDNLRNLDDRLFELEKLDFIKGSHKLGDYKQSLNASSNVNSLVFQLPFQFYFLSENMTLQLEYIIDDSTRLNNGKLESLMIFDEGKKAIIKIGVHQNTKNSHKRWAIWIDYKSFRKKFNEVFRSIQNESYYKTLEESFIKERSKEYLLNDNYILKFNTRYLKHPFLYLKEIKNKNYDSKLPIYPSSWIFSDKKINLFFAKLPIHYYIPILDEFKSHGLDSDNLNSKGKFDQFFKNKLNIVRDEIANFLTEKGYNFKNYNDLLLQIAENELSIIDKINNLYAGLSGDVYEEFRGIKNEFLYHIQNIEDESFNNISYSFDFSEVSKLVLDYYKYLTEKRKEDYVFNHLMKCFDENIGLVYGSSELFFWDFLHKGFDESIINCFNFFKHTYFLDAVRANAQRIYSYHSQGTLFNELLLELESLSIDSESTEIRFVDKWINQFGIGKKLKVIVNKEGIGNSVFIDDRPLADNGYGVIQFLPILLKIAIVAKHCKSSYYFLGSGNKEFVEYNSSIILIEEVETNLHPRLQSMLADMFVDAAKKFHIQFIIETHSEYLIRKLQYLTANKKHEYNIKPEDTVIYYFNDPKTLKKGEKQVRRINIREDGILDGSFGSGFFDEASNLIMDILKLSSSN